MKKFMDWMTNDFGPKVNKLTHNPWVGAVQDSMIAIMPIIIISSLITILSIFQDFIPEMPDLSYFSNFSFGLSSIFVSFLIPYYVLEKKRMRKYKMQAGLMGIAFFIMLITPVFDEEGNILMEFTKIGSGGMFAAIVGGMAVAVVMATFTRFSLFKKDTTMPKFLVDSFDSMLPILVILLIGFIGIELLKLDLYGLIETALSPLTAIAQSFWGFVLIIFIQAFLYSFGISSWVMEPIYVPIGLKAIAANAAGASYVLTNETFQGWVWLGGSGATLMLSFLLLFAKSKKLKAIGKTSIVPSLCNINEPLVFGAPIIFNPLLMIPMWICGLVVPAITYLAFDMGLVSVPTQIFGLWYLPVGLQSFLINGDFRGVILVAILLAITLVIYYPFFKAYDKQVLLEEEQSMGKIKQREGNE